jgi:hypothetical protein
VPGERVEAGAPLRVEPGSAQAAAAAPADAEGATTTARAPAPAGDAQRRAPGADERVGTTLQLQPLGKAS